MSKSKAGKAGKAASPWGRFPHVPRTENYRRMRDWHLAGTEPPTGTCPHGYPQTVRCSRCGE